MAVLEKIRVKFGLGASIIIALGLLSFIIDPSEITSAFQSMSNKNDVGSINGKSVSYVDFQQQVEDLRVDVRQKYLTSDMDLVKSFRDLISRPIEIEVMKLRKEVNQLRDAIQGIYDCAYRGDCPVRERLREQQEDDGEDRDEEDMVGC